MDEHKDVGETSEERRSDHVATIDSDKPRIVESDSDAQICSVVVEMSIERASDNVAGADCEKNRIVDSAASDVQVGSGVVEISKETAPDHVASGDCENTQIIDSVASDLQVGSGVAETYKETATDHAASADCEKTGIVDSAASDVQIGSGVMETSYETPSDHVASGDCEKSRNVDSASSNVQIGSGVVDISKETTTDHVASGDCEKIRIVDSANNDVQIGSTIVVTLKETVSNHVASADSEKIQIVESAASDIQVQVQDATNGGSSTERVDAAEGGVCNGADVTVEIMLSDMHVDGDSTRDTGDDGGGKMSEDGNNSPGESKEIGSERHMEGLIVESDEAGDSGSKTITKLDVEALELKSEGAVENCSEIAEYKEEKLVDDQTTIREVIDVGVEETQNMAIDSAGKGSACAEGQVELENMAAAAGMEVSEGTSRKEYVKGSGVNVTQSLNSSEIRPSENELHDGRVENGETEISTAGKSLLADEALDMAKEIDEDEGDSIQESETEMVGVLCDGTSNPDIDTEVVHSSTEIVDPTAVTRVFEEEAVVVESHKNHENQISIIDGSDVVNGGISSLEKVSNSEDIDPIDNMISKSLDGDTHVAVDGTVASTDNEDIANIEGMDSDAFNEKFYFSVEELQETFEIANGSTENHYDAFADSQSLQQLGDVVATENKIFLNSEKDENLVLEEFQNRSMSSDSWQVHSNVELEIGDDNQVADNGKACLQKENGEVEIACSGIANNTDLDSTSCHPDVGAEVAEIDDTIHSDPKFEVSMLPTGRNPEFKLEESGAVEVSVSDEVSEEQDIDSEEPKTTKRKLAKQASLRESTVKANGATYHLPPDVEGEFGVSDLVWGKVRSHPWWPGQIFHPSDASEKAMKYHKKDSFLVAYFGDGTFAWNDASVLKPFRSHFSRVQKQSNSETFHDAVNCALEEVSRRVEFGLACSCIPEDIYNKIKHQMVENAGIRQESSVQNGTEKSLSADLFEPGKLVEYMKALAQSPDGGTDRVQIVIARSQLLAFYRLKGYSELPEFQFCGGLLDDADTLQSEDKPMADTSPFDEDGVKISSDQQIVRTQRRSYHKRKHNLKDDLHPKKKERTVTELMVEPWDSVDDEFGPDGKADYKLFSPSSGKERMGPDSLANESESRKSISLGKACGPVSVPKPSFKIGECIRRVASQMTGSPSILKCNNQKIDESSDGLVADGSDELVLDQQSEDSEMKKTAVSTEYSSLNELLVQLYLAARDPLKGYSFLTVIVSFFSDFRNAVIMEQREKVSSKKRLQPTDGAPETFEFEDMNDTYWTDWVIQNGSEEQPPRKSRKRDNKLASGDPDKPLNKSNYGKRNSDSNHSLSAEKPVSHVDENAPAELVMHFPVVDSVPSEASLVKMFKRFGPLKESETEVDKDTNRARVVFKKCSDAKAAHSSAMKFNIFGSMLVNYQLNNTITVPFKTEPLVTLQGQEDATVFLQF